ncbi:MAG: single-stranded-DNA-specific exonuclease RecJ [Coriobacteriia bacterium]|nr:single-stranded-DNA-specific exonuclease RecJ [Coriobacteriia bacterium]MBN2839572.1 single-stranded-DNA-specific exonuclease RecJ [Coriobacteriia bacterium]
MTDARPSASQRRWDIAPADVQTAAQLAADTGLSAITARILLARGVSTPDEVRAFLEPSLERDWPGTGVIPGMAEAAARVADAIGRRERIVVFGDFDLDGISAAATATLGIRALGGVVEAVVPHRFSEGYGLSEAALERVAGMRPDLVITVDCGISNAREVAILRERGIDAVITDHHEPGPDVPSGVPVANPKLAENAPPLAGAGVALALIRAVGERVGEPGVWRALTDLAMLGTVADMVPLTGANRALVTDGLARARRDARPGIAALAAVGGVDTAALTSDQVAFALAPRLNAAGRMADPAIALSLLLSEEAGAASDLAHALDEHNRVRQSVEGDLLDAALAEAGRAYTPGDRVLVVAGEGWHEGVRGIVASRLVSRFGVPALVFCIDGDEAQGSGRSLPGIDLYAAVARLAPMLTRYGGHEMAVGATLPAVAVERFRDALREQFASLPAASFETGIAIDAEVPLDALSRELAAELALLGPFGFANRRPMLSAYGVFMNGRKRVGKSEDHLRFTAYDGVTALPSIAFRCDAIETLVDVESAVDIAFELELDQWRGVERVQLLVRDVRLRESVAGAVAAELVDDLFAHAEEIIARGEYAGIGEAASFHTKLAGVTFEGRQGVISRLAPGMPLRLERQPDNGYDPNACALFEPFGDQVGYLNRKLAAELAPVLDAGVEYDAEVADITGGAEGESLGVNVLIERRGGSLGPDEEAARAAVERRSHLAALAPHERDAELVDHFIGDRTLHAAQVDALAHLAAGRSTLAVMATGRGKSLIFHLHAAREAIARRRASVFVYPLRALVADQAFVLEERFGEIGLSVLTLTGETSTVGRDAAFAALADGSLDVVLTTPEFLDHHVARFAGADRVGFVVVDEAHHVGLSRAGHRPAYARLGSAAGALGGPTVLAATATAPDDVATAIVADLGITSVVLDPTVRENLAIADRRGVEDKVAYIAGIAARGEKVIVYVNSRDVSVKLARQIRTRLPDLTHRAVFYNGGMTREVRHAVERAFREGDISVVVATSAFGEGVNIGDVRHVVLYHLPMGEVEFNQLCGRGGRDGKLATVHLLYGERDVRLNRMILESAAPSREDLGALYLTLRESAGDVDGFVETTNAELAEQVKRRRPKSALNDKGVSTGIGVFRELGLVASEGTGAYRRLRMLPAPEAKLDLADSVRYAEGLDELAEFEAFRIRALGSSADELLHAFDRPILPTLP